MLMRSLFIIIFLLIAFNLQANFPDPVKVFVRDSLDLRLLESFERNGQELINSYRIQTLVALSYYPELSDVTIHFRQKNLRTTMASIPRWTFIFRKKKNRTYHIYIDTMVKGEKGLLLKDVPFNAQIGVIGHELAHVADYEDRTTVGLVLLGMGYLFPPFHKKLERKVDQIAIAHGLGYQVRDFSDFVFHQAQISGKYQKFKYKYYFDPEQLKELMSGYSIY